MKYMGSKNRIADKLLPIILADRKEGQYYIEPFVGGCNMIDKVDGNRIGSDVNEYLIAMWRGLQSDYLIRGLFPLNIPKELYAEYRNMYNLHKKRLLNLSNDEKALIGWIGFMGSFNGRFFDGGYSGHDVKGRDYIEEQIQNTALQIPLIKGIKFMEGSYDQLVYPNNSIIYCDIPYKDTKQYGICTGFSHDMFFRWVRVMSEYHTIFISEYEAPNDFEVVTEIELTNSMSTKNTYKKTEKLFRYYG